MLAIKFRDSWFWLGNDTGSQNFGLSLSGALMVKSFYLISSLCVGQNRDLFARVEIEITHSINA
jgi:hypothetical protein